MKKRNRYLYSLILCLFASIFILYLILRPQGKFVTHVSHSAATNSSMTTKVLTWNILQGKEDSLLNKFGNKRKRDFFSILTNYNFDILCFQEVLPNQLAFFKSILSEYDCIAAGRDDGLSKGEHSPIFFNKNKYSLIATDTFWLSPTPDTPSKGWGEIVPRICTWVELVDKASGTRFRIYNIHLQLSPYAQYKAAKFLSGHLNKINVPLLLVGDMNCSAKWPAIRILKDTGLNNAETSGAFTYHFAGIGLRALDHIFFSKEWKVNRGGIINNKGEHGYPSDHFGMWAEMEIAE